MADVIKSKQMDTFYVLSTRIQIEFTIGTGNRSTNSTPITYRIYIINNDSGYDNQRWLTSNSPQASLTFGGNNISVTPNSFTIVGTGATNNKDFATIASGTFSHKHNSNGVAGTVNFSTTVDPKIPAISNHGPVTITGTVTIPNIVVNTKSTMRIPSQLTIGEAVTASVSSSSSSYFHIVYISVGGSQANLGSRTGGGNITAVVPSSLATGLGSKVSAQGTAYISTYTSSGGSLIGTTAYSVTVRSGVTVKPTMTGSNATVVDTDAKAKAITGGNNKDYIATISDINVTIPNSAIHLLSGTSTTSRKATIYKKGTSTKIEERTTTGTSIVINNIPNPSSATEEWDVKVSIQDSRGVWSDEYLAKTIKVYRYVAPTANATVNRHGTTPTTIVTSISFTYSPLTIGGSVKNNLNLTLRGGYVGDTATELMSKDFTSTSGTWAPTITGVANTRSYIVGLIMDDGITSTTIEIGRVGTEEVPLDVYKNGIGVGKIHSGGSTNLEVGVGGIDSLGPITVAGKSIGLVNQRNNQNLQYWVGTKAQFDAISTKSSTTIYDIIG